MKRKIYTFLTSLISLTLLLLAMSNKNLINVVYAWDDCPKGLVNDEYPGSCSLYIDTDENGICDHSEPAPEERIDKTPLNPDSTKKADAQASLSASNNTLASLAVIVPLGTLIGYTGMKKYKTNKNA